MKFAWMRDAVFFLVAACMVMLYVARAGEGFPLDDSWIHQVYGRNLAQAGEWAFVPGQPSGASTSPLYTVLLALGYFLNIPYLIWTHALGIVALALTGGLGARMADKLLHHDRMVGWLAGFVLILSWHLIWAAAAGMETMLFAMLTLALMSFIWHSAGVIAALKPRQALQHGAAFGLVAALAVCTRPEGALLAGLCGGLLLLAQPNPFKLRAWVTGAMIGFGLGIVPYVLLNLHLNNSFFPATADAKQAQHAPLLAQPYHERLRQMALPIMIGGQVLLLPGVLYITGRAALQSRRERERILYLLPVLWALALIALYAARLPAAYQHGRYVLPALPGLVVVGTVGLYHLWHITRESVVGRVLVRTLSLAALLTLFYFGLVLGPSIYARDVKIINEEMVAPAKWIAENIAPDELLALHDIGAVGYFAPRPLLDIAGLLSEEVVPLIWNADGLWTLMQARDARYLMAFADQIPGQNPADERLCFYYQSEGASAVAAGGSKMVIYRLAWNGQCV